MKKLIIITVLIALYPGFASGQAGGIGIFPDGEYASCDVPDVATGLVQIYVVHKMCPGATASRY